MGRNERLFQIPGDSFRLQLPSPLAMCLTPQSRSLWCQCRPSPTSAFSTGQPRALALPQGPYPLLQPLSLEGKDVMNNGRESLPDKMSHCSGLLSSAWAAVLTPLAECPQWAKGTCRTVSPLPCDCWCVCPVKGWSRESI